MPRTGYTEAEIAAMGQFNIIPNFNANSFTLFNRKNNIVIENAISTDSQGNVIFKDSHTKLYLEKLVQKARGIKEEINDDGTFTLFFQDKFNRKYSLGEIYYNLFASQAQNMEFWFGQRVAEYLEYGLDQHIIDDHMTIKTETNLDNPELSNTRIDAANDTWKNHWHTIPCLQVVVPDYVDSKYASISATVCFSIKTNTQVSTGFRIFDATTGIELTRVIHKAERNNGDFTTYTIPLHYQGPLPDTKIEKDSSFTGITYDDVANLEYENGVEEGIKVMDNIGNYEIVPYTRHIIRLQWITCSLATDIDDAGQIVGNNGRFITSDGQTTLDVAVFDSSLALNDVSQLNGVIDTSTLELGQNKVTYDFPLVPSGLDENYSISFTPNKNIRVILEEKRINGFTISWNKIVEGLRIDWSVIYRKYDTDSKDEIDIARLTDPNRKLNHHLFPNVEFTYDFCKELEYDPGYRYVISDFDSRTIITTTITISPSAYIPAIECCKGSENDVIDVKFKWISGGTEFPFCISGNEDEIQLYRITDDYGKTVYTINPNDVKFLAEFIRNTPNFTTQFVDNVIEEKDLFRCVTDFTSLLNEGWGLGSAYDRYYYDIGVEPETMLAQGETFTDIIPENCVPL